MSGKGGGGEGKVVCVTGASGYIASWLVKLLLLRGYTVKASVRNPNDPKKTEHLLALDGAKERLHLFQADLLEEGSFDPIVDGCEGVFHTASPVHFSVSDPQVELIDPALKGTVNVLRSCAKIPSIKRVVLTSSMVAVFCNRKMLTPGLQMDETWFSDPLFCKESKTLAEEAAWKFAKENGIDLTVINPGWVIGPLLQPTLNATVEVVLNVINEEAAWKFAKENGIDLTVINPGWVIGPLLQPTLNATVEVVLNVINGAKSFPNASYRWVDVRDVANAHIQAFEIPSASGRYCVVNRVAHFSEVVKILHELYPALDIPEKCENDAPFQMGNVVVNEKAKGLGIEFTPLEVTLKDTVESLKEKNFVAL
ncbi:hypothetical protein TEA_025577 [Camellia sinensis var. sinensis]|uniref:Dihydroflavonol 4-reductase n=1 Tax=Camellia sinensis var. sinensis TaxID=542762 RepID=A0A4S4DDL4_CAMSN|nr:hypothetical protein TEA_025577 [Camellia sinensis var. sinensis]